MKIVLADRSHCTGCGACANSCPKKAITMIPDAEGFIQPTINEKLCVECGICEQTCPVLHPQYINHKVTSCYAVWASDEMRSITSTAGFFLLLAQKTIQVGGIVYGAAWTGNWKVHHIGVDSAPQLSLLCGSKYLQSDVENSYQEAKANLLKGRNVLFSGCPCQIAGLYGYLGSKKYSNLTTVEIICHGVPSPKAFHKYLDDNFNEKEIEAINFRDKTVFGWSSSSNIYFKSNKVYRKSAKDDPFYQAFLSCMIVRKSCSICPFSKLPRQADISIGDFWGIKAKDPSWHDKKGTGLVLINNQKGQNIFKELAPFLQRYEKFPLDAATRVNKTILHPFSAHPGRKHFFSSIDLLPFNSLVKNSMEHNYDIGIVGLWYGINYGSVLTYYSLYHLLRDLGRDPVMLPKPPQLWDSKFNSPDTIAQKFIWSHCNVFNKIDSPGEINRMNDRCKDFILGSDVVWSYRIVGKDTDQFFFLDWVESGHKKLAFASSFGNTLYGTDAYVKKAICNLQSFDAISMREDVGAEKARELTGRSDIAQVLDPVFLCNKIIFDEAAQEAPYTKEKKFIFAYLLKKSGSDQKKQILDTLKSDSTSEVYICGNPNGLDISRQVYGDSILPELSVEAWLWHIKNCDIYVGDSYHGLCFALIYHKPFIITYGPKSHITSHQRFESLLRLCNLENRILYGNEMSVEQALNVFHTPIDWDYVDISLAKARMSSIAWLKDVLDRPALERTAQDYIIDNEKRIRAEQQISIDRLQSELQNYINSTPFKSKPNIFIRAIKYYQNHGTMQTGKQAVRYILQQIRAK